MNFWSFLMVGVILLWFSVGKLVNSDSKSGELFRQLIAALIERVRGGRKSDGEVELQPQPPEVTLDDQPKPRRFGGV